jgi:hypothetical protein
VVALRICRKYHSRRILPVVHLHRLSANEDNDDPRRETNRGSRHPPRRPCLPAITISRNRSKRRRISRAIEILPRTASHRRHKVQDHPQEFR